MCYPVGATIGRPYKASVSGDLGAFPWGKVPSVAEADEEAKVCKYYRINLFVCAKGISSSVTS